MNLKLGPVGINQGVCVKNVALCVDRIRLSFWYMCRAKNDCYIQNLQVRNNFPFLCLETFISVCRFGVFK
jgi:hypothetical protein